MLPGQIKRLSKLGAIPQPKRYFHEPRYCSPTAAICHLKRLAYICDCWRLLQFRASLITTALAAGTFTGNEPGLTGSSPVHFPFQLPSSLIFASPKVTPALAVILLFGATNAIDWPFAKPVADNAILASRASLPCS